MRRLVLESAVLLIAVIAIALTLDHMESWSAPTPQLTSTLAMFGAAVAVAAALVAEVVARLADRPALRRVAAALAVYGLIVVPATAAGPANSVDSIVAVAIRYTATLVTIGLLLLAVATFDRPRPWPLPGFRTSVSGTRGLLVGVLCAAAAGVAAATFPYLAYSVVQSPAVVFGISLLWLNVGVTTLVSGLMRRRRMLVWIGFGELAIVSGHAPRLWMDESLSLSPLLVPGMQVIGLGLILTAVLQVAFLMYQRLDADRERLAEAEAAAVQARERMSVQAHELRNALAGVDGAAQLLAMEGADQADRAALRAAMSAELNRMRAMLESESARPTRERVNLKALLENLVLIRRGSGTSIYLTAEDDLTADVHPDVIAQVMTNILVNCERHAPGAQVWVTAYRLRDMAHIEVQDDGPGVPLGREQEVMRRGAKSAESVGDGIGLYVCQELVTEHGGRLRLVPARPDRPGCTLAIDLPITARPPEAPLARRSHRGSTTRWLGRRRPSGSDTSTTPTSIGSGNADR